ncbi:23S rRNA (guanosine(2251)-2'-O)-methyltransferase RlmB [Collinsella sp. SGI.178]|uniref:23S rRNA (guanosine(2251)-2'-O)-methyltransferase RlmB n=1 Tax=Collinsella sp. SGI.178 TaxID=3420554 RepID=UPI003D00B779
MAEKRHMQKNAGGTGKQRRAGEDRNPGERDRGKRPAGRQGRPARPGAQAAASQRRGARAAEAPRAFGNHIEGRRAAFEALRTGFPIKRALIAQGVENEPAIRDLLAGLGEAGVSVKSVPRTQLDAISSHGAHQGIVLEVGKFPYADLSDIIAAAPADAPALVVVLDHVTDAGNFGAIVRSAEVVGAAGVVIPNKRSAEVTVATYKTSAGAVMHLPIAQVPNIARALEDLKSAGFWVGGATEHAEDVCWDAPFEGRVALVMGSEGDGISRLVLEKCDFLTKLPQRGMTESLNVAQATTALCFEWLRRNAGELMGEE